MPRFILDVANTEYEGDLDTKAFMVELCERLGNHFISVVCIDKTNENQFHEDLTKNKLTKNQINSYNEYLKTCYVTERKYI
jgi:hypothetical protein